MIKPIRGRFATVVALPRGKLSVGDQPPVARLAAGRLGSFGYDINYRINGQAYVRRWPR